ncbi:hypothetical protein QR680_011465 [Steinernema hermaphroditum]|uniref:RRM domain-containing protein n=1 Tax=Steinernema hermaphroditum TaxID=289476 RepID=A0AA39HYL3_9BILA|nr:hypothetical protein QR680_011465 [Steinernema hermaphroditum]
MEKSHLRTFYRSDLRKRREQNRANGTNRSVFDRLSWKPVIREDNANTYYPHSSDFRYESIVYGRQSGNESRNHRRKTANSSRTDRVDNRIIDLGPESFNVPKRFRFRESNTPRHERKIYVARVASKATEDDLLQHFSRYGTVQNVILPRDRGATQHRGYGYVLFTEKDCMGDVLNPNFCHIIHGRELDVQPVMAKRNKIMEEERLRKASEKVEMVNMFQAKRVQRKDKKDENKNEPLPRRTTKYNNWRLTQLELGLVEPESEVKKEEEVKEEANDEDSGIEESEEKEEPGREEAVEEEEEWGFVESECTSDGYDLSEDDEL